MIELLQSLFKLARLLVVCIVSALAIVVLFGLAGCGGGSEFETAPDQVVGPPKCAVNPTGCA